MELSKKRKEPEPESDDIFNHNYLPQCFVHLSVRDLVICRLVSKFWKNAIERLRDCVWQDAYSKYVEYINTRQRLPDNIKDFAPCIFHDLLWSQSESKSVWKNVYTAFIILSKVYDITKDAWGVDITRLRKQPHLSSQIIYRPYIYQLMPLFSKSYSMSTFFRDAKFVNRHITLKMISLFGLVHFVTRRDPLKDEWIIIRDDHADFHHMFFLAMCLFSIGQDFNMLKSCGQTGLDFIRSIQNQNRGLIAYELVEGLSTVRKPSPEFIAFAENSGNSTLHVVANSGVSTFPTMTWTTDPSCEDRRLWKGITLLEYAPGVEIKVSDEPVIMVIRASQTNMIFDDYHKDFVKERMQKYGFITLTDVRDKLNGTVEIIKTRDLWQ